MLQAAAALCPLLRQNVLRQQAASCPHGNPSLPSLPAFLPVYADAKDTDASPMYPASYAPTSSNIIAGANMVGVRPFSAEWGWEQPA